MKNLIIETNLFKGSVNEDASGRTLVKGVLQRSGAENQNGNTPLIRINIGSNKYKINADSTKEGVIMFL